MSRPVTESKLATELSDFRVENPFHWTLYRYLGAHPGKQDGQAGVHFAVWAPNATEVSVISDRNSWQVGQHQLNGSERGVWSGFIPGYEAGDKYKFAVRSRWGQVLEKSDPYAFAAELRPNTASIIADLSTYEWNDQEWIEKRDRKTWINEPVSTYEVHLGSWRRPTDGRTYYNYRELAPMLVEYVKDLGYTHLQLMPVSEHPFDGSWGYQTTGYYSPTSRFGTPEDFMYFVDYCHQHDLGVLIDWVPAHFPADAHSLGRFDGTALYEHDDPRQGFHPDWNTNIFNYGREEVRNFLFSSAYFWPHIYHIDGLRVDAVASMLYLDYSRKEGEWIPNQYGGRENLEAIDFLREVNTKLHADFPGIMTVAEESTSFGGVSRPTYDGGLGFTMKWDMGWMNDTLRYMRRDPIYRSHHQNELSFRMVYAFTENFVLPLSHDEVVHGKRALISQMPGDYWQQFANLRMLYAYQYFMPGKKLLFMGGELAQWTEWNHDTEIDWALQEFDKHQGISKMLKDLNELYSAEPAMYVNDCRSEGFAWIQCDDYQNCVYAFIRSGNKTDLPIIVVANYTPVPHDKYRIGLPQAGYYQEVFNSDRPEYGGSGINNEGGIYSEPVAAHGHKHSLSVTLPPLGLVAFKPLVPTKSGNRAAETKSPKK
ncbi:MAG: 1,4-alpha-glucan branching enzyme [Planctomyces sp.]|nr:1,4-alpha-glucan branching enzyme [Planctomyces sp.]